MTPWGCLGTSTAPHQGPPESSTSLSLLPSSSQTYSWAQLPVRTRPIASAQGTFSSSQGPPSLSSAPGETDSVTCSHEEAHSPFLAQHPGPENSPPLVFPSSNKQGCGLAGGSLGNWCFLFQTQGMRLRLTRWESWLGSPCDPVYVPPAVPVASPCDAQKGLSRLESGVKN